MPTIRETIESRWSADWDKQRFAGAWIQMNRAFRIESEIRDLVEKVAQNPKLSAIGRQDQVREALSNGLGGDLHKLRKATEVGTKSVAAWKARVQAVTFDRSDAAGAMIRAEMRTMLRIMKPGERHAALLRADADEQLMLAALEAPNLLSGIDNQIREQILESVARRRNPNDVAAIEQAAEAISIANVATRVALNTAKMAGEFPDYRAFETFLDKAVETRKAAIESSVDVEFSEFGQSSAAA